MYVVRQEHLQTEIKNQTNSKHENTYENHVSFFCFILAHSTYELKRTEIIFYLSN